jgi:hypothetical protein
MQSHEALKLAIGPKATEYAKRLGLSSSTVYKWTEPSADYTDSGAFNPLDRVEVIVETALALTQSQAMAFAPIYYLTERFNLAVFPLPKLTPSSELTSNLLQTIEEFSDLTHEASAALADGRVTKKEARSIEKEGMELIRQVVAFIHKAKESVK